MSEFSALKVPRDEAPSPAAGLSAHSYSSRTRFSWPGICSNLTMFKGLCMTKSSVYSRAIWVQLPTPVGGKTEMRLNFSASTFNPLNSPTLGKFCWQADVLSIKTYKIKANQFFFSYSHILQSQLSAIVAFHSHTHTVRGQSIGATWPESVLTLDSTHLRSQTLSQLDTSSEIEPGTGLTLWASCQLLFHIQETDEGSDGQSFNLKQREAV